MWAWLNRSSSSKSTPIAPPMKSEDYEYIMKRLTDAKTEISALRETVEAQDRNFKRLEGLYYAKLHEPKKKEEEIMKESQKTQEKQAESEVLNPLVAPFY